MIEYKVDTYVADVVTEIRNFTTTTFQCTTTTTFPPCANQHGFCSSFGFGCPGGQSCTDDGSGGCTCVGPAPQCGSAGTSFCAVGVCPAGETCTVVDGVCGPIGCACR